VISQGLKDPSLSARAFDEHQIESLACEILDKFLDVAHWRSTEQTAVLAAELGRALVANYSGPRI